ncbi:SAM-dependent methyltransferase [Sulfoacidibacillus thermotolerans]|uniref:SAM-dependent methyltransferase n=1 Tax=Sulfoacidibacillus thermotolerans TaxID=1765684 RepID=A0A2U3D9E8_SULT2|nr:SAM-dependent methyltransferase [Sulfoacidibacillus thermotolerans]
MAVTSAVNPEELRDQQQKWEDAFARNREMFGEEPSAAGVRAAELFRTLGVTRILELGAGQGRDTMFFAQSGFFVTVLDYTVEGTRWIEEKARSLGLSDRITVIQHDIRESFPLKDDTFDACYSHMLYCMALSTEELHMLSAQIRRVIRPRGLNVYTTRHKGDPHYGQGIHRGEDLYEVGGFVVHFFDRDKVQDLADGYQLLDVFEFEEGRLPRRLYQVTMEKIDPPVRVNR